DDRLEAFYDNPNALRDYFRDIGRMVLAAEGRKANDSHADCYQYFCVPEYGTANGRLHFHAVHFMRTLPTGSVDPNFMISYLLVVEQHRTQIVIHALLKCQQENLYHEQNVTHRSEERFSRNAETDLVCRLLLENNK